MSSSRADGGSGFGGCGDNDNNGHDEIDSNTHTHPSHPQYRRRHNNTNSTNYMSISAFAIDRLSNSTNGSMASASFNIPKPTTGTKTKDMSSGNSDTSQHRRHCNSTDINSSNMSNITNINHQGDMNVKARDNNGNRNCNNDVRDKGCITASSSSSSSSNRSSDNGSIQTTHPQQQYRRHNSTNSMSLAQFAIQHLSKSSTKSSAKTKSNSTNGERKKNTITVSRNKNVNVSHDNTSVDHNKTTNVDDINNRNNNANVDCNKNRTVNPNDTNVNRDSNTNINSKEPNVDRDSNTNINSKDMNLDRDSNTNVNTKDPNVGRYSNTNVNTKDMNLDRDSNTNVNTKDTILDRDNSGSFKLTKLNHNHPNRSMTPAGRSSKRRQSSTFETSLKGSTKTKTSKTKKDVIDLLSDSSSDDSDLECVGKGRYPTTKRQKITPSKSSTKTSTKSGTSLMDSTKISKTITTTKDVIDLLSDSELEYESDESKFDLDDKTSKRRKVSDGQPHQSTNVSQSGRTARRRGDNTTDRGRGISTALRRDDSTTDRGRDNSSALRRDDSTTNRGRDNSTARRRKKSGSAVHSTANSRSLQTSSKGTKCNHSLQTSTAGMAGITSRATSATAMASSQSRPMSTKGTTSMTSLGTSTKDTTSIASKGTSTKGTTSITSQGMSTKGTTSITSQGTSTKGTTKFYSIFTQIPTGSRRRTNASAGSTSQGKTSKCTNMLQSNCLPAIADHPAVKGVMGNNELVINIFLYLPIKEQAKNKFVCKRWESLNIKSIEQSPLLTIVNEAAEAAADISGRHGELLADFGGKKKQVIHARWERAHVRRHGQTLAQRQRDTATHFAAAKNVISKEEVEKCINRCLDLHNKHGGEFHYILKYSTGSLHREGLGPLIRPGSPIVLPNGDTMKASTVPHLLKTGIKFDIVLPPQPSVHVSYLVEQACQEVTGLTIFGLHQGFGYGGATTKQLLDHGVARARYPTLKECLRRGLVKFNDKAAIWNHSEGPGQMPVDILEQIQSAEVTPVVPRQNPQWPLVLEYLQANPPSNEHSLEHYEAIEAHYKSLNDRMEARMAAVDGIEGGPWNNGYSYTTEEKQAIRAGVSDKNAIEIIEALERHNAEEIERAKSMADQSYVPALMEYPDDWIELRDTTRTKSKSHHPNHGRTSDGYLLLNPFMKSVYMSKQIVNQEAKNGKSRDHFVAIATDQMQRYRRMEYFMSKFEKKHIQRDEFLKTAKANLAKF